MEGIGSILYMTSQCFFLGCLYEALGMYEKIPSRQGTALSAFQLSWCGSRQASAALWISTLVPKDRVLSYFSSYRPAEAPRVWYGVHGKPELCTGQRSGVGIRPHTGGHPTTLSLPRETAGWKHAKLLVTLEKSEPNQDPGCSCKGITEGLEPFQEWQKQYKFLRKHICCLYFRQHLTRVMCVFQRMEVFPQECNVWGSLSWNREWALDLAGSLGCFFYCRCCLAAGSLGCWQWAAWMQTLLAVPVESSSHFGRWMETPGTCRAPAITWGNQTWSTQPPASSV